MSVYLTENDVFGNLVNKNIIQTPINNTVDAVLEGYKLYKKELTLDQYIEIAKIQTQLASTDFLIDILVGIKKSLDND